MLGRARRSRRVRSRALDAARDALQVVFQPIRDLATGTTVGYEALSRFPEGSPDEWFGEAHELGRGVDLEMTALMRAVEDGRDCEGYMSVNVSPAAVAAPRFVDFVLDLRDPDRLVLELTEHVAVQDYDALCTNVERLRERGVRVAVDDAGGGISSFRHILMISPEIIKLDRSLIAGLDEHPGQQALAELMVQFAERTGAQLVAEGIERSEECDACAAHGIRFGQGYLFGAPAPA